MSSFQLKVQAVKKIRESYPEILLYSGSMYQDANTGNYLIILTYNYPPDATYPDIILQDNPHVTIHLSYREPQVLLQSDRSEC